MSDEDEIKEVTEKMMKAFTDGDVKIIIKNMDFKETKQIWAAFFGVTDKRAQMSDKDFEKDYKREIEMIYNRPWNKSWTIDSIEIKDHEKWKRATINVNAEGAKSIFMPLILSNQSKKWKMIQIPAWSF